MNLKHIVEIYIRFTVLLAFIQTIVSMIGSIVGLFGPSSEKWMIKTQFGVSLTISIIMLVLFLLAGKIANWIVREQPKLQEVLNVNVSGLISTIAGCLGLWFFVKGMSSAMGAIASILMIAKSSGIWDSTILYNTTRIDLLAGSILQMIFGSVLFLFAVDITKLFQFAKTWREKQN